MSLRERLRRLTPTRRPAADQAEPAAMAAIAQRILDENVLPFWRPLVDAEHGGYLLNHDAHGTYRGPSEKFLVTQARMVWTFSRLARARHEGALDLARTGYSFLTDRMHDPEHGGFYWAVEHTGAEATKPHKHLYAQAFALFALCEYAAASGDAEAARRAGELFCLIDDRAHDDEAGGYREAFTRSWDRPPPQEVGYLGHPPDRKLLNTHMHLLEATTAAYRLGQGERERERLHELMRICGEVVVDPDTSGLRDEHFADWAPLRGPAADRCSYGHDLETVALLIDAGWALGEPPDARLPALRAIAANAVAHGYDAERGGFFASGPLGAPADRHEKVWWAQAEALVGLTRLWHATGDTELLRQAHHTLQWVDADQVDRAGGDWHERIDPDGTPQGDKAGPWKDPYHQTRALLELTALR